MGEPNALPCLATLALSGNGATELDEGGAARLALTAAVGVGPRALLSLGSNVIDGRAAGAEAAQKAARKEPRVVSMRENLVRATVDRA